MYTILHNSNNMVYGTEGYQIIATDISSIYLGILCTIIIILIFIFFYSKKIKNSLYFSTIFQTILQIDQNGNIENDNNFPKIFIKNNKIYIEENYLLLSKKSILLPDI